MSNFLSSRFISKFKLSLHLRIEREVKSNSKGRLKARNFITNRKKRRNRVAVTSFLYMKVIA